jgi:micrococcal nuclease
MRLVYMVLFVAISWVTVHGSVTFNATVIRVVDGDSLHIKMDSGKRQKIRLFGIDAPEMLQKDGPKSGRYFATRIGGERVDIVPLSTDIYGRIVAMVYDKDQVNMNEEMVRLGLAWVSRRYTKNPHWIALERKARVNKIGIWRRKTITPPWEYRKTQKKNTK